MVYDKFTTPFQPYTNPSSPWQQPDFNGLRELALQQEMEELRKLIKDFREALAEAKKYDLLTNQPDCVDPKKAELEERVAALERKMEDHRL